MTAPLILSALIIIGTWLDVASTLYGHRKYRLHEANILWRPFLINPWLVARPIPFYLAETAFWGLMIAILFAGEATLEMFIVLCVVRFGTVGWNAAQIVKARNNALKPKG